MVFSTKVFRKLEKVSPDVRELVLALIEELEWQRNNFATKEEFRELNAVVKEILVIQKDTLNRLNQLTEAQTKTEKRMDELAEAQAKTEKRMDELAKAQAKTEKRMDELAVAQAKTEKRIDQLAHRMDELAEAQVKTEKRIDQLAHRMDELAEAQAKTEKRMDELAKAQTKTEKRLETLVKEHQKTREMVGGLSNTVGYILEDRAFKQLPELLREEFGLELTERPRRRFVRTTDNENIEVNIIAGAVKDGKEYVVLGESKSQLSKKKINEFLRRKVKKLKGVFKAELFLVFVTHMISEPDVEEYAREKGIRRIYYSYEF